MTGGIIPVTEPQSVEELRARYAATRKRLWEPPVVKEDPDHPRVDEKARAEEVAFRDACRRADRKRMNPCAETLAAVRDRLAKGTSPRWISESMAVPESVVLREAAAMGVRPWPESRRSFDWAEVGRLREQGVSYETLMAEFRVSKSSIRRAVAAYRKQMGAGA